MLGILPFPNIRSVSLKIRSDRASGSFAEMRCRWQWRGKCSLLPDNGRGRMSALECRTFADTSEGPCRSNGANNVPKPEITLRPFDASQSVITRSTYCDPMPEYRAQFFKHSGQPFGGERFHAANDEAAIRFARSQLMSPWGKGHEIWQGDRLVHRELYD